MINSIHISKSNCFFHLSQKLFLRQEEDGPLDAHFLLCTAFGPNTLFQVTSVLQGPTQPWSQPRVPSGEKWAEWNMMKGMAGSRETFLPGLPQEINVSLWGPGDSQPCWRAGPCEGHGNAAPSAVPRGWDKWGRTGLAGRYCQQWRF